MKLHEYCDIRVSGHNPYRFINALRSSPIVCEEQRCIGDVFYGRILRRDVKVLEQLAHSCQMEAAVQERRVPFRRLRHLRLRFGLVLGLLLGASLILWRSNVVETIEIQGADTVDARVILSILEEEGVERGTWIREIDILHCENQLRTAIPEVAWAGIRRTGNRMVVQIAEERPNVPMLHERVPCNIIARYDAQITGVSVHAGQLCHILGDGVTKGELLVSGVRTDEHGHTTFLYANAEIRGIYTREAELSRYFKQLETLPTGRMFQRRKLRIFHAYLPMSAGKCSFAEYHVTHSDTPLYFLGFRLPCSVLCDTFEETVTQERMYTEDEVRLALNADIVRFEKNLLSDVTILDRNLVYDTAPEGITAHLTYRVEGEIGEPSEIFLMP